MTTWRYKRKNAYALSRQLRRRFYKGAAIATLLYVILSLVKFHGQLSYLPYELAIIWAVFLLCYSSLKEVLRWNGVDDAKAFHGETWVALVIIGALWMILWNIGRVWIFHLTQIPFPEDYEAATVETIVLYTLSVTSSFLYKSRYREPEKQKLLRQKTRGGESPALNLATIAKKEFTAPNQEQKQKVEVRLTKTSALDEKDS